MAPDEVCPRCGAKRPVDAPQGLCPACLLAFGLGGEGSGTTSGGESGAVEPTLTLDGEPPLVVRASLPGKQTASISPDMTADAESTGLVAAKAPDPGPKSHPERVGKYEVRGRLGGGGQGSAFLARDPDLGRLVVLKRYHTSGEDAANEGKALCRVRSRYTAQCYDLLRHGGGLFLVMEYIPGRTLSEVMREGPPGPDAAARLIEQAAGGLAEVHACGLLHRDITPRNIILGDDGVPRLVDFGLAVSVASEALHAVIGSPPYMAPEQARGQGERVDARSDVYGLGAVLYSLLTGQPPHDGKTLNEILERARDAPIVPPRRINPRVPRALERVCLQATAAEPQSRYPSADALRRALRRYLLMRRAATVLGAVAVLLALLVPAWAFRPGSARPSRVGPGRAIADRGPAGVQSEPKRSPRAGLKVTRFEVPHFPKLDARHFDPRRVGSLGRDSFAAREDDEVTVRAELSEPAYAYLIAFRPDGTDEICDPDGEDTPPPRTRRPMYPPPSKSDERYRLSEGAGLHAFALVVSLEPLPPYREWKRRHGPMPWAAKLPCESGVVWRDDDRGLQPLLADETAGTRGKGVKARGSGASAAKLASWLRGLPGVDVVALEAFPVEPASGP